MIDIVRVFSRRAGRRLGGVAIAGAAVALSALGGGCQGADAHASPEQDREVAVTAQAQTVDLGDLIGQEVSVPRHLEDGEEFTVTLKELIAHGQQLFAANWTGQEGGGRPLSKGTGGPLADLGSPLLFPRNFNRVSAPDANSCAGCHNLPGPGGGGDIVANVFVLGQRFDFVTLDPTDTVPTRGAVDENGNPVTLDEVANSRATIGMFGSGYTEMLARQITQDLQAIRDLIPPDGSAELTAKGISFGVLARDEDGSWDTSSVEGLSVGSLASADADSPPSLVIKPFHQAGAVVSLRQFANNAFNHHHGIQSSERFGYDTDPDGDGYENEMTRADITAVSVYQAVLAVPGRVIPTHAGVEKAVATGEKLFEEVGCADCHAPSLPLTDNGWVFTEPSPFSPEGNLQEGEAPTFEVDLTYKRLPNPRLQAKNGVVEVPIYSDFKLHDICDGEDDPNIEPLDMHHPGGSEGFNAGNRRFLTKRLWGAANEPPYFHHGKFTTMREAIEAHGGEAASVRSAYLALGERQQDFIIEFLKTLQSLPPGTKATIIDQDGKPRSWNPEDHL